MLPTRFEDKIFLINLKQKSYEINKLAGSICLFLQTLGDSTFYLISIKQSLILVIKNNN